MKFPYGLSDFATLIQEGFLPGPHRPDSPVGRGRPATLIFIRPRRFGKSLLLLMLEHYYDVNRAGQ